MIRFTDKVDRTESAELPDLSHYKEIKPILKISDEKVQSFWDDVFGEDDSTEDFCFTEDEIISEVFERYEEDFEFDFDVSEDSLQDILSKFDEENWNTFDESEKLAVIEEFKNLLCEKLGIEYKPTIFLFEDDKNHCGAFNHQTNTLELNRNILDNPQQVVNTVAHEVRHGYQYERACIGETRTDILYAINFLNYVKPTQIDGKYVNFNEYQNQLIEAEARAFAKLFSI